MDSELFFLMKTHNIRWQRAAIVLGGQRDSGPVRSVYPDNPGDNSGSLLFIAPNSRGRLLQRPRTRCPKAPGGRCAWEGIGLRAALAVMLARRSRQAGALPRSDYRGAD
jgi:hypothetical protein